MDLDARESPNSVWQIYLGRLLYKRTGSAAGPLKLACSPSHKREDNQERSRVDRASGFRVTRRLIPVAHCRGLLGPIGGRGSKVGLDLDLAALAM